MNIFFKVVNFFESGNIYQIREFPVFVFKFHKSQQYIVGDMKSEVNLPVFSMSKESAANNESSGESAPSRACLLAWESVGWAGPRVLSRILATNTKQGIF